MTGRLTLAEQLAAIRSEAPAEYDPESSGFTFAKASNDDSARADYLEVGQSEIRKNQASELDEKYAGTRASRSQLYDGSEQEQEDDGDEDDDEKLSEGASGSDLASQDEEPSDEDVSQSEDDVQQSEDVSRDEQDRPPPKASRNIRSQTMEEDSRVMLQQLKKASSADVEKGIHVRKQLSFWDTLLEARIRLQKCMSSLNTLPPPHNIEEHSSQKAAERSTTISSLEELSELLFDVRQRMHEKNDKLAFDSASQEKATRKRKRGSEAYVTEAVKSLLSISAIVSPYEKATVSKWSDKVASATGGPSEQNKFKALGTQNTWSQIENILSQDMPRLVERSKARKGNGGKAMKVVGRDAVHEPVEGEKDVDPEVFDDTDFYQALLREVVGSGDSANLNGGGAYASFNNVSKKKASATLDPKASKGRKIRYHVHEKLLSFMPPVPTNTWEKEQIDELFRGLLGGNAELEDESRIAGSLSEEAEVGQQIRIF